MQSIHPIVTNQTLLLPAIRGHDINEELLEDDYRCDIL